jgi:hypothetical protein
MTFIKSQVLIAGGVQQHNKEFDMIDFNEI